jgi:hypothetical protein
MGEAEMSGAIFAVVFFSVSILAGIATFRYWPLHFVGTHLR